MLLILTGSLDGSSDLVVHHATIETFRLNIDLISEYKLIFEQDYWSIENPAGHSINSESATRAWWWKAFNYGLDQDPMFREEVKYLFREIYAYFGRGNLIAGNPPDFENRFGKMAQLGAAHDILPTLYTSLRINQLFPKNLQMNAISKPLTSSMDTKGRVRQTTDVSGLELDPRFPWLVQELATAVSDITVLVLGHELFAYERNRSNLVGLDWRSEQFSSSEKWISKEVPPKYADGIHEFMKKADSNWGRIDFLELASGEWIFLEYNANGQWGFLEQDCPMGLPARVADFLCTGPTRGW